MLLKLNQISWVTVLFVGGIICALGLIGAAYEINYLQNQLSMFEQTQTAGSQVASPSNGKGDMDEMMDEMKWHLNSAIIGIFGLMTIWGFLAVRKIGGLYETAMVNELDECEKELHEAYQDNLHKSRLVTIGQTASVLAHEMHNPMSSIKLALSGLKGAESLTERELKKVELVLGEVDRLESLLSETLDYVRPVKLSEQPVELNKLVEQIIQQQAPVLEQKELTIDHRQESEPVLVNIDQSQFHQVLLNLITNAVEASDKGGTITTRISRSDNSVRFDISNSGAVMDSETQKRAFEPFYTTKSKGTGLGLGLVKRVVDEHGGKVSIESNAEKGTRVSIVLTNRNDEQQHEAQDLSVKAIAV